MVCPMKQAPSFLPPISNEYPIEALYRPWSWSLSTFMNIFLLVFIGWITWSMIKRARAKKASSKLVPFRKVVTQCDSSEDKKGAKVLVVGGMGRAGKALLAKLGEQGEMETSVLDLYIPEADHRESHVTSYIQCDPTGSEDVYIALQRVEAVYVMPLLTLPSDDKGTPPSAIPISDTAISNIIDGCRSCGVKQLVVVTEMTDTLSKVAAEHEAGKKLKVTERSAPDGSTALEQMVIKAAGGDLHSCVVRAGVLYHRHGDGKLKLDNVAQVNVDSYPTKTVPMVTVDYLAEVLFASAVCLSSGVNQGQVFLACGTTPEEQGLTWQHVSGRGPAVEVDDSESRRVLKI